jgi:hypothetical protein
LLEAEDDAMAHREQHSNREAKKPKKEKPKTIAVAPSMKGTVTDAVESRTNHRHWGGRVMPKARQSLADALARLIFEKPLAELDRSERAELNFLRALDGDAAEEERYQQLAADLPEEAGDVTVHWGGCRAQLEIRLSEPLTFRDVSSPRLRDFIFSD